MNATSSAYAIEELEPENKPNLTLHANPVIMGYKATVTSINAVDNTMAYVVTIADATHTASAIEGLLVCPEVGDTVLCIQVDNTFYISQVIQRKVPSDSLMIESLRPIEWVAPILRFNAFKEIELRSAKKLSLTACDLVCGATRSLIQQAHNMIQHAGSYSLTTKGLMRLNGRQQVIVAEEDLRIDAKRINMG